jgi:uncharacterized coiled-coil protein SlyX
MHPSEPTSRLTALEIQLAHIARQVEQLDEVVTEQALAADRQRQTIRRLIEQIAELRAKPEVAIDPPEEKPPHY